MMAASISSVETSFSKLSIHDVDFITKLPAEVLIRILQSVNGKDIVSCKRINIRLYYLIHKNAVVLPKFRPPTRCGTHQSVVLMLESDSRGQSKTQTGWSYRDGGVNARRNVERQLRVAANSRDTCYFDCEECAGKDRHWFNVPKSRPIRHKRQLISLKHYSFDGIKIRRPVNLKVVMDILKTGNIVIKNLHIDLNTNPQQIKEIVGLFIQNLTQITFEFCDPTACFNKEFLNEAQKLSEVKFMYCHENRMHIAEKLAQNGIFLDKINFEHCNLGQTDLNDYIKKFLLSDQKEKNISVRVKEDEKPNLEFSFVRESTKVFNECQKLLDSSVSSNITRRSDRGFGPVTEGHEVEINVGQKKIILEFIVPEAEPLRDSYSLQGFGFGGAGD